MDDQRDEVGAAKAADVKAGTVQGGKERLLGTAEEVEALDGAASAIIAVATMTKHPIKALGKRGRVRCPLLSFPGRRASELAAIRVITMRAPMATRIAPARWGAKPIVARSCGRKIADVANSVSHATPAMTNPEWRS